MKNSTLVHIERGDEWLMMHRVKKENDLNKDKWIGLGGKFEDGESPEECAIRECREEAGIILQDYRYRGIVTFVSDIYETEYMHLFTCDKFSFEPAAEAAATAPDDPDSPNAEPATSPDASSLHECDEGELAWIKKSEFYRLQQWEGDKLFLNLLETDEPFFSMKLKYEGDTLVYAALNGKKLNIAE